MKTIEPRGVLATASAALLAACGSTATSTVVLAPSAASGSATGADPRAVAAQAYLAAAQADKDKAQAALNDICGTNDDLGRMRSDLASLAAALDDYEQRLLTISFPPDATADARQLERDLGTFSTVVRTASNASNLGDMVSDIRAMGPPASATTSDQTIVRHDLGLPPSSSSGSACSS